MDKQEIKNSFNGLLPRGFTGTIQTRLKAKGIDISLPMISKVCDATKPNWNVDIITEALALAGEEKAKLTEMQTQAAAL